MADAVSKSPPKTQIDKVSSEHANTNPSKYLLSHFLYKAVLVTVFVVLLPLFPSLAPDFINQTLHGRSWELVQLIFVGIAVSYGLFSKKNDEKDDDDDDGRSKIDVNAQSYVSKLLQVSSVFDDEEECGDSQSSSVIHEDNKFELLNSQYYRGEPPPVVVVAAAAAKETTTPVKGGVIINSQKPLHLPVRSLKQRPTSINNNNRSSPPDPDSQNEKKLEEEEEEDEKNVVLRSPIPWRSRSGRMEIKENVEEPELNRLEKSFVYKPKNLSPSPSVSAKTQNKLSPSTTSFSSDDECRAKISEDVVRRKKNFSSPPPAPPPPPPPPFLLRRSVLTKSNSDHHDAPEKVLKRSVRSVPAQEISSYETEMDQENSRSELLRGRIQNEGLVMKSARTIFRPSELAMGPPDQKQFPKEEKNGLVEKVLVETSEDEDEDADYIEGISSGKDGEEAATVNSSSVNYDVGGPDVDKKADEFIAKFREQIRLQRIESIRRSTAQRAGNTSRS